MPNYPAKSDQVLGAQLKVQELCLPFVITGNATPASVAISVDDPALLFLRTEGVNKITAALDTADGTPSIVSPVDANGLFAAMIKVGEPVGKVLAALIVRRDAHGLDTCKLADTDGITAAGDKIILNCDSGVDLSAANLNACLVVKYVVAE